MTLMNDNTVKRCGKGLKSLWTEKIEMFQRKASNIWRGAHRDRQRSSILAAAYQ